jgi:guanylate kinase
MRRISQVHGILFIVSAPSGAGKTTLCYKLSALYPQLKHSVSYTTRKKRRKEIMNVHYTYVSENKFKAMIKRGEFAEWAVVHGNLYGTSRKRLQGLIKKGYDIILDIDTQGALQMKKSIEEAVYIFILPPSLKILRERLESRMSETKKEIRTRLKKATEEISSYRNYDYVIINDNFKKALRELESVIIAEKLRTIKINPKIIKKLKH